MAHRVLRGPAFGGKSRRAAEILAENPSAVLVDFSQIHSAITGSRRGPDGRLPVRTDDDSHIVAASKAFFLLIHALDDPAVGVEEVIVTSASRERSTKLAAALGAVTETLDPGKDTVLQRMQDYYGGNPPPECQRAVARWYGDA